MVLLVVEEEEAAEAQAPCYLHQRLVDSMDTGRTTLEPVEAMGDTRMHILDPTSSRAGRGRTKAPPRRR